MSRTKPQDNISNPAQAKLEWVGKRTGGYFESYDRDAKETTKIDLPLRFAYLDTMKSVVGFLDQVQRSLYSNEVRYTNRENLHVRYSKDNMTHTVANGQWKEIRGENPAMKFCNVVYATLLTEVDGVPSGALVKLPLSGTAGSQWIDLDMKDGESFEITGFEDRTKGATEYRAPLMQKIKITEEEGEQADEQDKVLQEYFESLKTLKKEEEAQPEQSVESANAPECDDDDVPF
jgi:hypothetical protein